jgi:hypothetical protein
VYVLSPKVYELYRRLVGSTAATPCVCSQGKYCTAEKHWEKPEDTLESHDWNTWDMVRDSSTCARCGLEVFRKAQMSNGGWFGIPSCPGKKS